MDRLEEKRNLHFGLGRLFGPLLDIAQHPERYNAQEEAEAIARYCAEYPELEDQFRKFAYGQAGHIYAIQRSHFSNSLHQVVNGLANNKPLSQVVEQVLRPAMAAIDSVPVDPLSVICEAGSPFTTYRKIQSLCEADATVHVTWLDPFISASVFTRYLHAVRPGVPIVLVAKQPTKGGRDLDRWDAFLDVSRLFAQERGPQFYRLLVRDIHDRWIVLDNKRIYTLGGSAKDAGDRDYFTIAHVEPTPDNLAKVTDCVANANEWFGPKVPAHR